MNIYQEHILDHYKNPRNVGELDGISARDTNPLCGDEVTVYLDMSSSSNRVSGSPIKSGMTIEEMKYQAKGCSVTVASASMLSEAVLGVNSDEVKTWDESKVQQMMGIELTPARIKCAMLPLWTLKKALDTLE